MLARERYNAGVGLNLHAHAEVNPHAPAQNYRNSNTFHSAITPGFQDKAPESSALENYRKATRDRQFAGNPVQPPATRQSYQDSDIFGTKGAAETVQRASTAA